MEVWGKLEHGDRFQEGDQMLGPHPTPEKNWETIPEAWHGNVLNRKDNITINRMEFTFRRRLKQYDTKGAQSLTS